MCYTASTVARYFIEKSNGNKTSMQLNKMTYIAHGWYLAIKNKSLIIEEVEAWEYGPVIPILFDTFKKYKGGIVPYIPVEDTKSIKDEDKIVLDKVFDVYDKYDGLYLSAMTHQKGTPWSKTWRSGRNRTISNDIIKKYYVKLGQEPLSKTNAA